MTSVSRRDRALLIVSVPFLRNVRSLLCSQAYTELQRRFHLLVVAPFAANPVFQEEFGGDEVEFLAVPDSPPAGVRRKIYGLSEELRFGGFYYAHRSGACRYHWGMWTQSDERTRLRAAIGHAIAVAGHRSRAWRIFDRFLGNTTFPTQELAAFASRYRRTVILQTANWGYQERLLAHFARQNGYPTALLPYTTDQLTINGHLLSDFALIFAQGPLEAEAAKSLHSVSSNRIAELGMLWLRSLEEMLSDARKLMAPKGDLRVVLYAGVASRYFARQAELDAILALRDAVASGRLPALRIRYRPIGDDVEIAAIQERFRGISRVEVERPQRSTWGMQEYVSGAVREETLRYLAGLMATDLMVMSNTTTMALDSLFLDCPTIANFADTAMPELQRRNNARLAFDATGFTQRLPLALNLQELVQRVAEGLAGASWHSKCRRELLADWDYGHKDYVGRLVSGLDSLTSWSA